MILAGSRIREELEAGRLVISPFHPDQLNNSSYGFRIGEELSGALDQNDPRAQPGDEPFRIPQGGIRLEPGKLYLGTTFEHIGSRHFVPLLGGSPHSARLGLFLQLSANLGNLGDAHRWTLELVCVQPVVVYAEMLIGRVAFCVPEGDVSHYTGEYTKHSRPIGNLRRLLDRGHPG